MEPLIFALIIMAISAFFSNKKKDQQDSPPAGPARRNQSTSGRNQGGFKRMEDYAKEIYGEFQAQLNPETDKREQVKEVAREVTREVTGRQPTHRPGRESAPAAAERIGGRLSGHQKPPRVTPIVKVEESTNPFPLTQDEAKKAIILAEIFMPPKSRRR